jgi:hypothetical protein
MTEHHARTAANIVMLGAAAGATYIVLRTPRLRRAVWELARTWVRGPLAVWAITEVRRAWEESRPAPGRT